MNDERREWVPLGDFDPCRGKRGVGCRDETRPAAAVLNAEIAKLVSYRRSEGDALVQASAATVTWVRWLLV